MLFVLLLLLLLFYLYPNEIRGRVFQNELGVRGGVVNYSDKLTKTSFNQIKKNIPFYQEKISFNYLIFLMYLL